MTTIKLKNGSGAPDAADLVQGEVALDLTNKRIYSENASGTVIEMGTSPSTIDINAGTIDGTVIGGASAAAITGTTITGTSFVSSGNMTFGDSDKAIFGAGSDLQIYHNGSHSIIADAGTGHLKLLAADLRINNAADTETFIAAYENSKVDIYYDNSVKLATTATGIDVTGTVTADALTVEAATNPTITSIDTTNGVTTIINSSNTAGVVGTNTAHPVIIVTNGTERLRIDSSGSVGIGTIPNAGMTGLTALQLGYGGGFQSHASSTNSIFVLSNAYYDGAWKYKNAGAATEYKGIDGVHVWETAASGSANGALTWTERMRIDSSGNVGIGTASPSVGGAYSANNTLTIFGGTNSGSEDTAYLEIGSSTNVNDYQTGGIAFYNNDNSGAAAATRKQTAIIRALCVTSDSNAGDDSGGDLQFFTKSEAGSVTERLRIASTGETIIGGATELSSENGTLSLMKGAGTQGGQLNLYNSDTSILVTQALGEIKFWGRDTTGQTPTELAYFKAVSEGTHAAGDNPTGLVFGVTAGGSETVGEAMRIDSSGNLLVGTTTSTIQNTSGAADGLAYYAPEGILRVRSNATTTLQLNRTSNDGNIAEFRKDGTTAGAIGTVGAGSELFIAGNTVGFQLSDTGVSIRPCNSTGSASDDTIDLGVSTARFKDLYLSGSVYLGGTTSANALDDYEEGTWTPGITDGTNTGSLTTILATYTKIGRMVHIRASLLNLVTTGMTAGFPLRITGLPFATDNITNSETAFFIGTTLITTTKGICGHLERGDTVIKLKEQDDAFNGAEIIVSAATSGNADILLNFCYQAA
jgi:hypothetical protein